MAGRGREVVSEERRWWTGHKKHTHRGQNSAQIWRNCSHVQGVQPCQNLAESKALPCSVLPCKVMSGGAAHLSQLKLGSSLVNRSTSLEVVADAPVAVGRDVQRPAVPLPPQVRLRRAHALRSRKAEGRLMHNATVGPAGQRVNNIVLWWKQAVANDSSHIHLLRQRRPHARRQAHVLQFAGQDDVQ